MEIKNNQVAADPKVGNKVNPRRRAEIKTNLKVFKVDLKKGAPRLKLKEGFHKVGPKEKKCRGKSHC